MVKKITIAFFTIFILVFSIYATNKLSDMESTGKHQNKSDTIEDTSTKDNNESKLPIIYIETNGKQIYKDVNIWSNVKVIYPDEFKSKYQVEDFNAAASVKYRGESSYDFDKKQYRIIFYKEEDSKKRAEYSFMGMAEHSEWVLNAPFLDRTLIRNHLLYGISKDIMDWAPDSNFCELYLDGKYQGVYLAVEPVGNGEGRLSLSEFSLLSGNTAFIIKRERAYTEDNVIHTYGEINTLTFNELSIEYPSDSDLTSPQTKWITKYISDFEETLYGDDFENPLNGYEEYIDVDSFVDYFIINEVSMNADAGELSTYCYKELNGKMHMAVWDFNNAYNNFIWDEKEFDEFYTLDSPWFDRLLEDPYFVDKIKKRYKDLRKTILSEENIYKKIDEDIDYLAGSIERNYEIWGYTFNEKLLSKAEDGTIRDPGNYEEAISQLKEAIKKRFEFLDENIDSL